MDQLIDFINWFIKYFAVPMATNASPLLIRGKYCIDFNKLFIDNKPLFGSNKTWDGFIIGIYMGFSVSIVISIYFNELSYLVIGLGSSIFALIGDLIGSFIKRRLGIPSGGLLPILDQLDFIIFVSIYYILINIVEFYSKPLYIMISCIIVLILHVLTNNVAYYLGVKDKRW
ncbi:MAG: CDP-archaeol synthase [Desulfurococcaceae archaeon]|uniref:CDP-archaeol synthase n=1 Tax=Staphylothermus marinus TaxID=2280 RepID=A0A7C4DA06_STAMA